MNARALTDEEFKQHYNEIVDRVRRAVNDGLAALEEQRGFEDAEAVKAALRGVDVPLQILLAALEYKYPDVIIEHDDEIEDEDESGKP